MVRERVHRGELGENELASVCNMMSIGGAEMDALETLGETYALDVIALTRGERGCRLYTRVALVDHPGVATAVVDTVGAGDAFTAALMLGLLSGQDLDGVAAGACRAAASASGHAGGFPPARSGSR